MSKFYVLMPEGGNRFGTKWAYADQVDPVSYSSGASCPVCGGPVEGRKWLTPHRIKLSSAKPEKWGDFVWGAGFRLIVSDHFKKIYETEGLRGIDEYSPPVDVVRVGQKKIGDIPDLLPKYYLAHIPWGGADQDDIESGLEYDPRYPMKCPYCRRGIRWKKQESIAVKDGTWHGDDLFIPSGSLNEIIVSSRFREKVNEYRLMNVMLIPVERFGYDEHRPGLWYIRE